MKGHILTAKTASKGMTMDVLLLKDIEKIGLAGQVVKVKEGYARNFLFPRKLAKMAATVDVCAFRERLKREKIDASVMGSRLAMLAHQIKYLNVSLKEKANEQGKLYGAVSADEIVALLKEKDITINRKQVEFPKSIRTSGEHTVIIKLSSKVKPEMTLKVSKQQ